VTAHQHIDQATLDAIRDRVNLVEFMRSHVKEMTDKGGYAIGLCPFHNEKTPSFTLWPDHVHCYGCGVHDDAIGLIMRFEKIGFLEAVDKLRRDAGIERRLTAEEMAELERQRRERERLAAEKAAKMLRSATRIIAESVPSIGTGVETYLIARGLRLPQTDDLLFHPDLAQWERDPRNPKKMVAVARWPAMVGVVRDRAGEIVGCHRTYLDHECKQKAPIERPKRMLAQCVGGAVRLGPPAPTMIGCEGIETGVALQTECEISVWCGLTTSGLAAMELPDLPMGAEIIAGADHDANKAGERAARKALARWSAEGRWSRLAMPPKVDADFADMVEAKQKLEIAA
jgi:hypothetical protein